MTYKSKGMDTGFRDCLGCVVRIGDRVKNPATGVICEIDKNGKAVGPAGVRYDLGSGMGRVERIPELSDLGDIIYIPYLVEWEVTKEEQKKISGESVIWPEDLDMEVPPRRRQKKVRKGATRLKEMEDEAVRNGVTVDEARMILESDCTRDDVDGVEWDLRGIALDDYQDEDLADELNRRGYRGEITKTKTIKI